MHLALQKHTAQSRMSVTKHSRLQQSNVLQRTEETFTSRKSVNGCASFVSSMPPMDLSTLCAVL